VTYKEESTYSVLQLVAFNSKFLLTNKFGKYRHYCNLNKVSKYIRVFLWRRVANGHNALWLTNSHIEMFSVYAGNVRSSCLVVGAVTNCSLHAGLQHWNFDHRNYCVSVEWSMFWLLGTNRKKRWVAYPFLEIFQRLPFLLLWKYYSEISPITTTHVQYIYRTINVSSDTRNQTHAKSHSSITTRLADKNLKIASDMMWYIKIMCSGSGYFLQMPYRAAY